MAYWYFFDKFGERQGPIDDETLVLMAQKRRILPETPMESEDGHRGNAGQIPGLFTILAQEAANRPVKKGWYCGNCGGPVPKGETVCLRCGARPDGSRRFCRRCGGALQNEQIVCLRCGTNIEPVETGSGSNVPAVFMYLVAFLLCNVFILFIIWSASKEKNPKVNRHGKNILNGLISWLIYGVVIAFVWGYFLTHYVPFFMEIHHEDEIFRLLSQLCQQLCQQNDVRFGLILPSVWVLIYPPISAVWAAVAATSGKVSRFWWAIPFFRLQAN